MPATRTRVVAVTSELPWPLNSGGRLRSYHLLRAFARAFEVDLFVPVVGSAAADALRALAEAGVRCHLIDVGARNAAGECRRVVEAAVRREPYVLYRRHYHAAIAGAVAAALRAEPSVLYLDHLDSAVYLPQPLAIATVADMHNAYSLLAQRVADDYRGPRRWYMRYQSRLLVTAEKRVSGLADVMFATSDDEQQFFARLGSPNVALVPNGVDVGRLAHMPVGRQGPPVVLYLGTMSWQPNAEAAVFLARHVLPVLRQRIPDAALQIVGKAPPKSVVALGSLPGVTIAADVPDIAPFLRDAAVMAVPLVSGGGTRLKVLEAFAAGLPVVSTAVGAEGIRAVDGQHLLLADLDRMADRVGDLLANRGLGSTLAARARLLAGELYDWDAVGAGAVAAVAQTLAARDAAAVTRGPSARVRRQAP
jgi:polysaccharide biosynthesis protein PslH